MEGLSAADPAAGPGADRALTLETLRGLNLPVSSLAHSGLARLIDARDGDPATLTDPSQKQASAPQSAPFEVELPGRLVELLAFSPPEEAPGPTPTKDLVRVPPTLTTQFLHLVQGGLLTAQVGASAGGITAAEHAQTWGLSFPDEGTARAPSSRSILPSSVDRSSGQAPVHKEHQAQLVAVLAEAFPVGNLVTQAAVLPESGLSLDLTLLRHDVDTFFAHLASPTPAGKGRLAATSAVPWLVLLSAVACEWVRRSALQSSARPETPDEVPFGPNAFLPDEER